jgi:hypothetical protein
MAREHVNRTKAEWKEGNGSFSQQPPIDNIARRADGTVDHRQSELEGFSCAASQASLTLVAIAAPNRYVVMSSP